MHKLLTNFSLLGSLAIIAHTVNVFESAFMLLLFGKIPGTSLMVPPSIMLVLWGILLFVVIVQQLISSKHTHFYEKMTSPAAKRRISA